MKTAIQQAIEDVKTQIAVLKEVQHAADAAPACIRILQNTIRHIEALLPTERQIIEDAFIEGRREYGTGDFNNSTDYFNQTFNQTANDTN